MRLSGCLAIALAALSGCALDIVETHYATLADYEDRGWLPREVLPPSARDILTVNNLDLSTSEGHFSFDPADLPRFLAMVDAKPPRPKAFERMSWFSKKERAKGRSLWHHESSDMRILFSCDLDAARCDYVMWTVR
jgi:hypothetical protein